MVETCNNAAQTVGIIAGAITSILTLAVGAWVKVELARLQRCSDASDMRLEQVAKAVGADE